MTVYEFNQNVCSALPNKSEEDIKISCEKVIKPFIENHQSNYYLLLNNDLHYYTFFVFNEFSTIDNLVEELANLVQELGPIKSINNASEGNALEFWIQYKGTTEAFMFFDYARGVIEIP